ncbi:MAG: HAMP domain-containing histidine kinase [Planctomycetes bacterium]|nr:HAMP domain-containing histidine kinase [Planctomycetota bacterium]
MRTETERRLFAVSVAGGIALTVLTAAVIVRTLSAPSAEADQAAGVGDAGWPAIWGAALATATVWVAVIWLMIRMLAHQRELLRVQRRFVADVSHELKTPLALIRMAAETLGAGRVREAARVHEYHETIAREAERLSMLLDSILDFSRIESGKQHYASEACDLGEVARQAWALFEPRFAQDGFDASVDIAQQLPPVRGDRQALGQVIVNLLQNAHRYAGEGKYVRLVVAQEGLVVVISVEDHGIGMTQSQLEQLGDSFYRAPDARVRRTRGTGLGLAIVHHIVTAHHGKLEVHSRPGQGSKFTVWLPVEARSVDSAMELDRGRERN